MGSMALDSHCEIGRWYDGHDTLLSLARRFGSLGQDAALIKEPRVLQEDSPFAGQLCRWPGNAV